MLSMERSHGLSEVYWRDNVLVIKPSGSFNNQGIQEAEAKVNEAIERRPEGPWARMYVFVDKDTMAPLDRIESVIATIVEGKSLGCKMLVAVGGNVINRESFAMISQRADIPLALCGSEEEAFEVIAARL